jgi:cullin 1
MSQLPKSNDLNATWNFVEPGLQMIIGGSEESVGVTPQMYMNVYSAIYNYCVNKSRSPTNLSSTNAASQSSLLVGAEIYDRLRKYLTAYVKLLQRKPTESFLEFYVKRWTRYTVGAGYLNHVFDYMNRYWVQKERNDGRRDIFDVNTLALLTWRDYMFKPNADALVKEILTQIELQRDNQVVDTRFLSTAIKSFVLLGIDIQDLKKPNLHIYIDHFEKPFLESTRQFYAAESAEYLSSHNVVDYLRKAEQRINEEESRETLYLDEHSKKPLTDTLNDVLIVTHAQVMYDEFANLLEQNQTDHISKMFSLLNRVPHTLDPLAEIFRTYIDLKGTNSIDNLKNAMQNEANKSEASGQKKSKQQTDPKLYVKALIQVYKKFQEIVSTAFQNHPTFVKALDSACRQYINNNAIAKPPGVKGTSKTPDLLAKYSDNLLKKNKDADATSDMTVDDIMIIFKFLNDKDAFETHYRRLLARRLIHGTSSSEEEEEAVIQRLQTENSLEYTSKITKMFQDVRSSHELRGVFKDEVTKNPAAINIIPDFEPYVLTETMWPFSHTKNNKFQLPADLVPTYSSFEELYTKKHNGRVLKWLWNLGRGDLKANLSKPGKAPFVLSATLYQMAILLPFNEMDTYTMSELSELTGLDIATIANAITPMIKYRLLTQSPSGAEAIEKPETKFTVVKEFKSKKLKVNLVQGVRSMDAKQDAEDAEREINEDRKNFLKACIVRIMKARKQLSHAALINEVVQQSHTRFSAKVADIKKCIDELVEKEYLQRNEDQSYDYLA